MLTQRLHLCATIFNQLLDSTIFHHRAPLFIHYIGGIMPGGDRGGGQRQRHVFLLFLDLSHFTAAAVAAAVAVERGRRRNKVLGAGVLNNVKVMPNESGWQG